MLDIASAIKASSSLTPAKLALGSSTANVTRPLTLRNESSVQRTYSLTHEPATATSGVITPVFSASAATVSFASATVTVPSNATATVRVTIAPPVGALQYGGYIRAQATDEVPLLVPYAGFSGDYQSIVHLITCPESRDDHTECFPSLATSSLASTRAERLTISRANNANFFLHYRLAHQARAVDVRLVAENGTRVVDVVRIDFVPRSAPDRFFAVLIDPNNVGGRPLPNGDYVLTVTVLKALGDPANPAHLEQWISGTITLRD
jgi:hypothetical protein